MTGQEIRALLNILRAILYGVVVIIIMIAIGKAHAQGHSAEHLTEHAKLHQWYSKLMRPDNPSTSCCSSQDCAWAESKFVDGKWWVKKNGHFILVPVEKINREESFDSQSHLCAYPTTNIADESILCFVKPGAGG